MLQLKEVLREQLFVEEAVTYAFNRNPALKEFDHQRIYGLAKNAALEIAFFEELAQAKPLRVPETVEAAQRIKAIWDLSGVGTYFKEFQDDRWKDISWSGWTDKKRLNYSGALIRRLTEKITGRSSLKSTIKSLTIEQINELRSDIEKYGPYLIYGSTLEQNEDVIAALSNKEVIIPKSKVHIIDVPGKPIGVNTVDQMKTFSLPLDLQTNNKDILALVAHTPHMVRTLHMMNRNQPLPEGLILQPHPIPSPTAAGTAYAIQEISGLLYYTFITGDSSEESYPYQI